MLLSGKNIIVKTKNIGHTVQHHHPGYWYYEVARNEETGRSDVALYGVVTGRHEITYQGITGLECDIPSFTHGGLVKRDQGGETVIYQTPL